MLTVPNFLDFTINAVLHPTFIRKLCYKMSSIVTFTFIQIFLSKLCLLYWMASELPRSLDTASKFALFSVSDLKDEKLIKKQTYMEAETCKLYSKVFWIFLPNFIKIDPYNFELYCFKVGAFFEIQCMWQIVWPARYNWTANDPTHMFKDMQNMKISPHCRSTCPLLQAVDGYVPHCSTTSSCQSAATSKTAKRCCSWVFSCKQRCIKYPDLYLYIYH